MSAAPSKKTLTGTNGDDNVQNIMVCWVMKYSLLCQFIKNVFLNLGIFFWVTFLDA